MAAENGMIIARKIEVIETQELVDGRTVTKFWLADGQLLATHDPEARITAQKFSTYVDQNGAVSTINYS